MRKKTLIALVLATSTSLSILGIANAQSSVTMYGKVDAGIGRVVNGSNTTTGFTSGTMVNNDTSRVGIKGLEDLGGGLKAGFQLESGINMGEGSVNAAGAGFWGRQANLSVIAPWGNISLGRQFTAAHDSAAWMLPGSVNYRATSIIYGYAGYGPRDSSSFVYRSPDFGGVRGSIGYIFSDNNSGHHKLDGSLSYQADNLVIGSAAAKVSSGKTNWTIGGRYNFGGLLAAISYADASERNGISGNVRRGVTAGVRYNFSLFSIMLEIAKDTKNTTSDKKYTNGVMDIQYLLSKRTKLYTVYFRRDGENNYGMGLQHDF